MIFLSFFPACLDLWDRGSGGGGEPSGGNILRLIRIRLTTVEFEKVSPTGQDNSPQAQIFRAFVRPADHLTITVRVFLCLALLPLFPFIIGTSNVATEVVCPAASVYFGEVGVHASRVHRFFSGL